MVYTYPWYRGGVSEWVAQYIGAFPDYDFNIIQIATDPYLQTDLADALYDMPRQVQQFRRIEPPDYNKNWELPAEDWVSSNFNHLKTAFSSADIIHVINTSFAGWFGKRVAEKIYKRLIYLHLLPALLIIMPI